MKIKSPILFFVLVFSATLCKAQSRKIDSLKLQLAKHKEDSLQVRRLIDVTQASLYVDPDTAIYYAYKASLLSERINWKKGQIRSGYWIGWCNYFIGNYDTALACYNRLLLLCKEMESSADKTTSTEGKISFCAIYGAIGDLLSSRADYSKAIRNFYESLKYAEQINNKDDMAKQNNNIGYVHLAQANYTKAMIFFNKALKLREETGNKRGIALSLEGLGGAYHGLREYDKALQVNNRALDIVKELGDARRTGVGYINIAKIYRDLKNYAKAQEYDQKALTIFQKMGDKRSILECMVNMGNTSLQLKKFKESENYFKNALAISDSIETLHSSADIHLALSEVYMNTNDAGKVFENYEAYTQLKDSIYSEENKRAQMQAEVNFEFEKKEAVLKMEQEKRTAVFEEKNKQQKRIIEISIVSMIILLLLSLLLLRSYRQKIKTNKLLAAQKIELEKAGEEKDSLLKEIHHRVKNNLQVISGLLSLQNNEHQSDELKAILKEGQSRVKSMALIHQMLYQHQNLSTIPFQNYLEELSKLIEKSFDTASKKIEVSVDAQNISFDVDTAIPLGLIINELLSNSIKYAFENKDNGGRINISLQKLESGEYNLTIKDNGKGLPNSFNFETAKSLGLRLVKMLCTQIRGELKMETTNGTQIEIKFRDTWKN